MNSPNDNQLINSSGFGGLDGQNEIFRSSPKFGGQSNQKGLTDDHGGNMR